MPWCHGGTSAYMSVLSVQRPDVYHLPSMHIVYMAVRIKFVALECYFIIIFLLINTESWAVRCIEQETCLGDKFCLENMKRRDCLVNFGINKRIV